MGAAVKTPTLCRVGVLVSAITSVGAFAAVTVQAAHSPFGPRSAAIALLAAAHDPAADPNEPIAEVRVTGNRVVAVEKIMAEIRTRPGLPPQHKLIQDDIARLVATRQFFDVGVEYLHEPHGLVVLFRVLEGNQIREIVIEGNKAISTDKLREKAGLKIDKKKPDSLRTFDIARAKNAASLMEDYYHDKGYSFAQVLIIEGAQPGDARLLYRVMEGPKVQITDVDFEFIDANTIGDRRLATQIDTKPRRLGFFGGKYKIRQIDEDVHKLAAYYHGLGFFDAKVSREVRESDDRSKVQVVFVIEEGQQYVVRSIEMKGNQKFAGEQLAEGFKLAAGQPFYQSKLQHDVKKVEDKYGAIGHIKRKVNADVRYRNEPGEVDVVFTIDEGEPYYVGQIMVTGNTVTKDSVIRRELRLYPGELYDLTAARRSEANLRRTQLFLANYQAGTGPTVTPIGEGPNLRDGNITDVEVHVDEGQTGRMLFGVGVNSDAGVIGNIIISEQNFDLFNWPSSFSDVIHGDAFRGGGQEFRLEAAPGTEFSRYLISWRQPRMFDLPYSFGVSGHYFQRNYREYDEARGGGAITVGHHFSDQIRTSFGLRLENIHIGDPDKPTPKDLDEVLGDNFVAAVTLGAEHDTRDNPFMPTCGHLASINFEQGFGDFTFPSVTLEGRRFFAITERMDGSGKQVLGLRGTVGFAGDNTPLFERFFAGGFRNFRGFEFRGVGPVGENNDDVHVGGDFMLLGSVEYLIPITADDALQVALFSDFGTVEESVEIDDFRVTAGIGFRVAVPILGPMPLAFDFAVPLHAADTDDEQIFSFTIGIFR